MKNLVCVLFILEILVGCASPPASQPTSAAPAATSTPTQPPVAAADPFKAELEAFMNSHPQGDWWLKTRVPIDAVENFPKDSTRNNVQFVLTNYAHVTKETRAIAKEFAKFNIGLAIETSAGPGISIDARSHPDGKVTVMFFPQEDVPYHPSSLWYNDAEKMVCVAAVQWPPKVFAGMLMHELYHAYRDAKGLTDKSAPDDSDVWIGEEVDAHTLEAYVLDKASGGTYFRLIDEILADVDVAGIETAYKVLTPGNLTKLDGALDTRDLGQNVMNALVAEHMFVVGLRFAEKRLPATERRAALIKHYRTTRTRFGN